MDEHGRVILFGSGESAAGGRRLFQWLFERLAPSPTVAILETPAGFEPNSAEVAGELRRFLERRLQNFDPQVSVIPARKKGTPFSPDRPDLIRPLHTADVLFMGPGSPTYAVRQLRDSLAWQTTIAAHRQGATVVLASAMAVAISSHAMPVYEIYKVGEELHWKAGLDFFAPYGLSVVWVPHWNNTDGGEKLDTSRCYLGQARFERLAEMLPPRQTIVGLDEHTALVMDLMGGECRVMGPGGVTILRDGAAQLFPSGETFDIARLGPFQLPTDHPTVPDDVWEAVAAARQAAPANTPPPDVLALVAARQDARQARDWPRADNLRDEVLALGWQILDTPDGPQVEPA